MKVLICGQIVTPSIYRLKTKTKHTDDKIEIFYTNLIQAN